MTSTRWCSPCWPTPTSRPPSSSPVSPRVPLPRPLAVTPSDPGTYLGRAPIRGGFRQGVTSEGCEGPAPHPAPPRGQRGWDRGPGGGSRQGRGTEDGAQLSLLSPAERPHHAQEKMRDEDLSQWDTLVVMSGDGLLHEVRGAAPGSFPRPGWGTKLGGEGCWGQEPSFETCRQKETAKRENPAQSQQGRHSLHPALGRRRCGGSGVLARPRVRRAPSLRPCRW